MANSLHESEKAARSNPPRTKTLDGFWIDRHTVTNARYQAFLDGVGDSRMYAHPDEPLGKDYTRLIGRRRPLQQPRPVVGIDWYDAYALHCGRAASCPASGGGGRPQRHRSPGLPLGGVGMPAGAPHRKHAGRVGPDVG